MTKHKKIKGTVTEVLTFKKQVEIEVDENADEETIRMALCDKALDHGIPDGINGWYMEESDGIKVEIER